MSASSYYRSQALVFTSSADDLLFFPPQVQQLLMAKPLIQTMVILLVVPLATQTLVILEPNRAAIENMLRVFPKTLIGVLAVVFPNVRNSDKDMMFCTLSEDDFDGGLFFYPFLAWNRTLLPLLGLIGLLFAGTKSLGWICAGVNTTKASDD